MRCEARSGLASLARLPPEKRALRIDSLRAAARPLRRFSQDHFGLAVLLACGVVVRIVVSVLHEPVARNYPYANDSAAYLQAARSFLFSDPLRPAGYPLFLKAFTPSTQQLWFIVVVQHLLGLITAALFYLTLRRAGAPTWVSLVPAAVVALSGHQVFLEHAVLSETLFTALLAGTAYAGVRSADSPGRVWPFVAGGLLAASATVRAVAVLLIPLLFLWLLAATRGSWRRRVLAGGASLAVGVVLLLGYAFVRNSATGQESLAPTLTGGWSLYARVGQFADCGGFRPPPGTAPLCEDTPPSRRLSIFFYLNNPRSPANRMFGSYPHGDRLVGRFARAVILSQPLDYVTVVGTDVARFLAPDALRDPRTREVTGPEALQFGRRVTPYPLHSPRLAALAAYEEATAFGGLAILVSVSGVIAGLIVGRGEVRLAVLLLGGIGVLIPVISAATLYYTARYGVPAWGFLSAGGALGVWTALRRHVGGGYSGTASAERAEAREAQSGG